MIKDLYPVNKYPFEQFLIENNYSLNDNNTWKKFIHHNYCIHLERKRNKKNIDSEIYEPCRRKKIPGKEYCGRHAPKDEIIINKCNYNCCKKSTKLNKLCYIHKKQFYNICNTPLPFMDDEEIMFYGHTIYNCQIKNTKIIIKEYINNNFFSNNKNNKLINYSYFSLTNFLFDIYNKYKLFILNIIEKYNINVNFLFCLISLIYNEFNKNDKKVSDLSNLDVNINKKQKKKKRRRKIKVIDTENITTNKIESQNTTETINPDKYDIYKLKYEYMKINKLKEILLKYHKDNNISDACIKFYLKEINRVLITIKDDEDVYNNLRYHQDQFFRLLIDNLDHGYIFKHKTYILNVAYFYSKNYYYFIDNFDKHSFNIIFS